MSSNEELCNVLLQWLQTFRATQNRQLLIIDHLTDGVVMAQVLHEIAPEWFSKMWLSKIKLDVGDNWRLKVSNLKKIIEAVTDYYHEFVNQNISFVKPDAVAIGERKDIVEMVKLLQLILGCAVNCEKKQEYIEEIMLMEESIQSVIMQSIQELETLLGSTPMSLSSHLSVSGSGTGGGNGRGIGGIDDRGCAVDTAASVSAAVGETPLNRLMEELQSATEAKQRLAYRCAQLESQLGTLQEEKQNVCEEKRSLEERLEKTVSTLSKDSGLRKQIDCLKEEIFKLETSRDDYRVKLAMREKEMEELQVKFDSLQRAAAEARHLKDEVDILREDADKAEKLESTLKSYKKKLEELSELKREMKLLEEKNLNYVQQTLELEEELKKANVWRTQSEMYKKQYLEARNSLNEETKKSDRIEFEKVQLQEKLNAVQREKERLVVERDSLKETNEELLCSKLQLKDDLASTGGGVKSTSGIGVGETASSSACGVDNGVASVIDLKRELMKLQHENTLLKIHRKQSDDEKLPLLQAMYDDTSQQNKQLRNECRLANQRILQLEAELKELQQQDEKPCVGGQTSIKELSDQLQLEKGLRQSESAEKDRLALELKHLKSVLFDALAHKDQEYDELAEKYRKCLDKARSLAKSLDCVDFTSNADENDSVRRKIAHKVANAAVGGGGPAAAAGTADTIVELEKHYKQAKLIKETEEKLIISALFNLVQKKHQDCVDHRLMGGNTTAATSANSSYIVKQRQSAIRRGPLTFNPK